MSLNPDALKARPFEDVVKRYSERDTMLYALGLGFGADPLDPGQLRFVYEEQLQAVPSMCVVLGGPGFFWREPDTGVDWVRIVHGEQGFEILKPLPAEGEVIGRTRITGVNDKGADKGALVYTERELLEKARAETLARLTSTTFCRGDGGCGGQDPAPHGVHALPDRTADAVCELPTVAQAALIYRLSGDYNPLHADPEVARKAGFERPILHGLCTLGIATHAILREHCGYEGARLKSLRLRFSAPVYPGETIRTETWNDDGVISFRSTAVERDVVVLNNGRAQLAK